MCFARDSITHITTFKTCQLGVKLNQQIMYDACQQFIGITAPFIDFQTGVTATQTFQRNLTSNEIGHRRLLLIFQSSSNIKTTGTADIEFAFVLRIKVQQNFPLHSPGFQAECTIHSRFFILGNQGFQWTMLQVIIFEHRHNGSHSQTIICSQRSSFGFHPITVNIGFNGICCKIVDSIVVLLGHHVHMRLKDDALAVFHTRSGRLTNNNIADLVDK